MVVLELIARLPFGSAFIEHVLCGSSWEVLGARHGVRPDSLRRAWQRCLRGTIGPPRGAGGAAGGGHGSPAV